MRNSRDELASFFRTIDVMAGILFVGVIEGFLLQRWRELEFWVALPNFVLLALLCVVMCEHETLAVVGCTQVNPPASAGRIPERADTHCETTRRLCSGRRALRPALHAGQLTP
jgi:hypothetical protein